MQSEGNNKLVGPSEGLREVIDIDVADGTSGSGGGAGGMVGIERTMVFPGILSPGPGSLPPISPNLFSPLFHDPNNLNLQHDLSVIQHGNRNFMEGSYLPSPFSATFTSPNTMFSPTSLDFLQHVLDG